MAQKGTETSLIEKFLYPKFGPGQLWEHVADQIREKGGEVLTGWRVDRIEIHGDRIKAVEGAIRTERLRQYSGDYFFSTMPVKELMRAR